MPVASGKTGENYSIDFGTGPDSLPYALPLDNLFTNQYPDLFKKGPCTEAKLHRAGLSLVIVRMRTSVQQLVANRAHFVAFLESVDRRLADIIPLERLRSDLKFVLESGRRESDLDVVQGVLPVVRLAGPHFWFISDPRRPRVILPDDGHGPFADEAALAKEVA